MPPKRCLSTSSSSSSFESVDIPLKIKRAKPEFYDPEQVWEVDETPHASLDLEDQAPSRPASLGYKGQFNIWTPDHVILESSDGHKFSMSKPALGHSSTFFKDLLDQPNPAGPFVPIPIFVPASDMCTFLQIIEDQEDCTEFTSHLINGVELTIPSMILNLNFVNLVEMAGLADRFDCEVIGISVKDSLDVYYANHSGCDILEAASEINSLPVARIGIAKLGEGGGSRYYNWWNLIGNLRLSWQIELTKLVWQFQLELVNRPDAEPQKQNNGRRRARTREFIMVQTAISYDAIAAAFNPPPEGQ